MTPDKAELLNHHRRQIAAMQRQVAAMDDGRFTVRSDEVDVTEKARSELVRRISELEALVERQDPEGFTKLIAAPTRA
ncbi:MAG: hypothetical protein AB1942_21165 [Pseudomonadota bacterium]